MQRVIRRFLNRICERVEALEPRTIVDLGCGEGIVARELALRMGAEMTYLGLDLSVGSIEVARRINASFSNLVFDTADVIRRSPEAEWADVALCLEVLEHMEDPRPVVERLVEWSRSHIIVSVPWEPWFRLGNLARGRHPRRLGNHPEHVQQFRPDSLERLLVSASPTSSRVSVDKCFPWLIATIELRPTGEKDTAQG